MSKVLIRSFTLLSIISLISCNAFAQEASMKGGSDSGSSDMDISSDMPDLSGDMPSMDLSPMDTSGLSGDLNTNIQDSAGIVKELDSDSLDTDDLKLNSASLNENNGFDTPLDLSQASEKFIFPDNPSASLENSSLKLEPTDFMSSLEMPDFEKIDPAEWFEKSLAASPFSLSTSSSSSDLFSATLQGADAFLSKSMGDSYTGLSNSMTSNAAISDDYTGVNLNFASMKAVLSNKIDSVGTTLDDVSLKDFNVSDAKDHFYNTFSNDVKNFGAKPYSIPSSFNINDMLQKGMSAQAGIASKVQQSTPNYDFINSTISGNLSSILDKATSTNYFDSKNLKVDTVTMRSNLNSLKKGYVDPTADGLKSKTSSWMSSQISNKSNTFASHSFDDLREMYVNKISDIEDNLAIANDDGNKIKEVKNLDLSKYTVSTDKSITDMNKRAMEGNTYYTDNGTAYTKNIGANDIVKYNGKTYYSNKALKLYG